MYNRENEHNTIIQYFITKMNKKGEYCLDTVVGIDEEWAKKVLADKQAKDPEGNYRIETEETRKCWWCYGTN